MDPGSPDVFEEAVDDEQLLQISQRVNALFEGLELHTPTPPPPSQSPTEPLRASTPIMAQANQVVPVPVYSISTCGTDLKLKAHQSQDFS